QLRDLTTKQLGDLGGMVLQQAALHTGQVIRGQLGDLLEQLRTDLVVTDPGRQTRRCLLKTVAYDRVIRHRIGPVGERNDAGPHHRFGPLHDCPTPTPSRKLDSPRFQWCSRRSSNRVARNVLLRTPNTTSAASSGSARNSGAITPRRMSCSCTASASTCSA